MSIGVKRAMSDQEEKQSEVVPSESDQPADRGPRDRGRRRHRNQPRHLEASINMSELRELIDLITANGLTNFELEREGFRVKVGRGTFEDPSAQTPLLPGGVERQIASGAPTGSPAQSVPPSAPPHPGAHAEEAAAVDQDLHIITSPIVGSFYRSPSPTAESFIRIGSQVEHNTVVCIIEAMKLMNEIQAETTGEVVKIYVENAQAVEYGQPLFGIKTK
ncbi:MAG: acetyl-CoA carboxylase biotin carboxyl carrier protein [Blastocatellia bacterium]|jgi:acetyl-CoA carboxylase biotin carboxyl carrier protein|nr:acetyl-CoA carboxylase biotin carboxyl carrier protein [Blastocatellia bacterium]MDX6576033.1 acetyl-CoA carboxylase biotin carboxyl carrier protein [Blastocatellia bacterium]